ncbi:potassium transporter Kup [Aureimonas phyllosphaerae]|uniref:Probable potassium transport system protein Kup n=1 Tax=Aureimonas phyllosphaerae TaxID=1166078 RepID=A0A7W6FSF3_9HYPH|nr:potassium transporter Kup [Aureimonas phyllosphaerae]MBB3933901.1 KUP system potassium uptake protein [Aureimonas phyllosphaerae]MBB3958883.1 KUP system potassium uptake protein [Aureimonas phyllosphaerae]SFF20612.1 KUP system potassium uptake protein [Aureimonas phyllosphaerae]
MTSGQAAPAAETQIQTRENPHAKSLGPLILGSIGVVYGDIGTSPLYAMKESLLHVGGVPSASEIIGIVSLLVWSLIFVVTVKYVMLILRADNQGEGGPLSLMALAQKALAKPNKVILGLGIVGAALFYGDAILTPAVSVLSAVEGLKVTAPGLDPYIVPIALVIIIGLYAVQSFGTSQVARFFGPIMAIWFVTLALIGISHIGDAPQILHALNPINGFWFMTSHGIIGFTVLGSVFLAVTGAEALYADMGHFGKRPIQIAWLGFVGPALLLNYLGQGAYALHDPAVLPNLFFLSAPEWARLPLVILATMATIIAGQAVITGAFSLTQQAIQLGLLPRLQIEYTSETEQGQIYLPTVNWLMLIGVVLLVLFFQDSSSLAAAYGIAVTGTMVVTSLLAVVVFAYGWKWGLGLAIAVVTPFLMIDMAYLAANLLKLADGGYLPLVIGGCIVVLMAVWVRGVRLLNSKAAQQNLSLETFIKAMETSSVSRVPGTALYLTSTPETVPSALLHNLKHNRVLHERNVIVTIRTVNTPYVPLAERIDYRELAPGFARIELHYGFLEEPNLVQALIQLREKGIKFDVMSTTFFVGRRRIRSAVRSDMPRWQSQLFIKMARHSYDMIDYYKIPANRVVELGTYVTL